MLVILVERDCPECGVRTQHLKRVVNHALHLFVALLTWGVWLIGWIVLAHESTKLPLVCVRCGSKHRWKPVEVLVESGGDGLRIRQEQPQD